MKKDPMNSMILETSTIKELSNISSEMNKFITQLNKMDQDTPMTLNHLKKSMECNVKLFSLMWDYFITKLEITKIDIVENADIYDIQIN